MDESLRQLLMTLPESEKLAAALLGCGIDSKAKLLRYVAIYDGDFAAKVPFLVRSLSFFPLIMDRLLPLKCPLQLLRHLWHAYTLQALVLCPLMPWFSRAFLPACCRMPTLTVQLT
jgi:hypothetical protein